MVWLRTLHATLLMRQTPTQRLVTLLCLVAFAIGQTLFGSLGVWCTDGSGEGRLELACLKSSMGACLTPCSDSSGHEAVEDHSSDPVAPMPCEDQPLGVQVAVPKPGTSAMVLDTIVTAVIVAVIWDAWPPECVRPACAFASGQDRERPPDSLVRLRTVILVV